MPEVPVPTPEAAAQAENAVACLALGQSLERLSLALTVVALLALAIAPLPLAPRLALCLAAAAGLVAQYYALRTAFDRPVFAAWARRWRDSGADPAADLAAFDAALAAAGLGPSPAGPIRSLADRLAGVRRLLRRLGLCCILQVVAWLAAILLIILTP